MLWLSKAYDEKYDANTDKWSTGGGGDGSGRNKSSGGGRQNFDIYSIQKMIIG
jgi:hypothetical protein